MKTITKINQNSTGTEFEITHCTFFTDLVHYSNPEYPFTHLIQKDDFEFIEEDLSVNITYAEFQKAEAIKTIKRNEIVKEAYRLFPKPFNRNEDIQRETYIKTQFELL